MDKVDFEIFKRELQLYTEKDDKIIQIQKGYGYPIIGIEGYAFLNIKPTYHQPPLVVSNDRILLKFIVDGSYNLDKEISGNVEKHNSEQYNKRKAEFE